ncbi:heme utilization cystosolic carrier protein HutX [Enterovirga aerilata]|uniref:Heme utilization cystosolic carrier protein HutX n=1 Tax=Enterovirga aerilata TaxID=2730920 RepID=A0A849I0K6_9HYPH|nr:heme utilization cystosolic carrier protein HutX [Enterovirga sp. DB1703]NNM72872.1 heme utilization cystosolic carrier protein HutX [Enterovirga sp. DB1703]
MSAALADEASRLRAALAAAPDGVLEEVARREGATYRAVLDALGPDQAAAVPGERFEEVWSELAGWEGEITFIVHTADGVFETRGRVPPGAFGRGYFNIHGDSPIGGHIRAERCAAIYFVDRPFFGRRSCSVQFVNRDGGAMFKIFVGRNAARELDPAQLARFEAAFRRYAGA